MNKILDKLGYLADHLTGKKASVMAGTIGAIWTAMPDTVTPNIKAILTVAAAIALIYTWSNEDVATTKADGKEEVPKT